ncbi:HflK protein [Suttonella ornithocola]|uniref:HflK protein n=1 Tax=Suttonella ornithocola TaxID=279832 RepID=A0A380MT67_9GAMM|nr:HflK protein [Suttonella ornithocola]
MKKIIVAFNERAIVFIGGQFQQVLSAGQHWIWHGFKSVEIYRETLKDLRVQWTGITNLLRFDRNAAEHYWQVIASPENTATIVWHPHMPAQVIRAGEVRAFWRPAAGESALSVWQMPQDDYRIPTEAEQVLLQQTISEPLRYYSVDEGEYLLISVLGKPEAVLPKGEYILLQQKNLLVAKLNSKEIRFANDAYAKQWQKNNPELFAQYLETVTTAENEILLWTDNGTLQGLIPPRQTTYFYRSTRADYQRITLNDNLQVPENIISLFRATTPDVQNAVAPYLRVINVPPQHLALLTINEKETRILSTGIYHFWQIHHTLDYNLYDLRLQLTELSGQELITEDKITVRINATCQWQITDALVWRDTYQNGEDNFYRELQFAVRAVVGSKTIDALLAEKSQLDNELAAILRSKNLQGIKIHSVGIKDIILPGEVRDILSRVVEAEKTAQANNIRRREETAATRSLLNTARVMEDNPTALRLKELETLEKVTEKIDKISVFGGLDGILNGLIHIDKGKK